MQDLVGDVIRGIGYLTLKGVTLGRYRSREGAMLVEGTIGLGVIAMVFWLLLRVGIG